jgi:hypothetical protein
MSEYKIEELEARARLAITHKTLRAIKYATECRGELFNDYDIQGNSIRAIHNEMSAILKEYSDIEARYNNKISLENNNVELEQATTLLYELFYYDAISSQIQAQDAIATLELIIHMLGYILAEYEEITRLTEKTL